MSCKQVLESEETWFLKKVCQRNNARILARVAQEFKLQIPTISDPYAYETYSIASCTTETLQYDMFQESNGHVCVMNRCIDTMSCRNGILCGMHPSEGVWLFKGPVQTNSSMTLYGGPFGGRGSTFPVSTNRNHGNYSWRSKPVQDSPVCKGTPCFVTSR